MLRILRAVFVVSLPEERPIGELQNHRQVAVYQRAPDGVRIWRFTNRCQASHTAEHLCRELLFK